MLGERLHEVASTSHGFKAKEKENVHSRTALVMRAKNLPRDERFYKYFDNVFLPLAEYLAAKDKRVKGVLLPAVCFESEKQKLATDLKAAFDMGAVEALVGNYGHFDIAKEIGFRVHGDFRLNVTNSLSAQFAFERGFESIVLSPELTQAQSRDIGGNVSNIVYGRLPVMLLEKCAAKESGGCNACEKDRAELCDRKGARFPILREEGHRNIVFNSVPTYAADRAPNGAQHFIFTTEDERQIMSVIDAYENRRPPEYDIRRIKEK